MQERKYHRLNTFFSLERICVGHTVKHINANHSSKAALDQNSHVYGPCKCFVAAGALAQSFRQQKSQSIERLKSTLLLW
jgi:hypothetical protein